MSFLRLGKKSVPPRGSGWVRSFLAANSELRTHPLPRGGTDFFQLIEAKLEPLQLPYSPTFKDHLAHPRNVGEIPNASVIAEEVNPVCGDRLRLSLMISNGRIETAQYLAYGCPPTLVTGSVLTELIAGKTVDEALAITRSDLIDQVGGLPSRKHHAAALAIEALASAVKNFGVR